MSIHKRLRPDQIKAGASYLLRPRYILAPSMVRKVERIEGDKVYVEIKGEVKPFELRMFADLAVEEVQASK